MPLIKQFQLSSMNFGILFTLISDVIFDLLFISIFTNRANKISCTPYIATPQFLFNLRTQSIYFFRSNTFYYPYNHCGWQWWDRLYQKMDIITISTYFNYIYFVTLGYFFTSLNQNSINRIIKNYSTIFCRAYIVI